MTELHLMHCEPDPHRLAAWAARHRLTGSDGDYGYALHALLNEAFGADAPKPFCYQGPHRGLLAYTHLTPQALQAAATLAPPQIAAALGLTTEDGRPTVVARPFPTTWARGHRLAFDVRIRPVRRTTEGKEVDAFLRAIAWAEQTQPTQAVPTREQVYLSWLAEQFTKTDAARVVQAGMTNFRLTGVCRQTQGDDRRRTNVSGPEATLSGVLEVVSPQAFAALIARGIGRHRAFGFGMLLLKPAGHHQL